ncbi:MAG: thioredoxin family protein [Deltaproteobacteria bacterium]|nr:thioredoxin family protein [Deltaproteobacteria bacterium]
MIVAAIVLSALTIHEDDFAAAQKRAQAEKKAIVVDLWAPWCHSCLSMKHYVFKDARVQALAKTAVFVAIDTEKDQNQALVARFKPSVWPTFLVLDSKGERVLSRLAGSATAQEFAAFVSSAAAEKKSSTITKADAALTSGARPEAMKLYQAALGEKGLTPAQIGRAAVSLVLMYWQDGRADQCALEGERFAKGAAGTYFAPSLRATAAECAMEKEPADKKTLERLKAALIEDLKSPELNVDDKSDLFATLTSLHEALGDQEAAIATKQARLQLLEDAAKSAPDPETARTFDAHRTEAYLGLDRPDDAIKMLTASEQIAPQDYNPPARLAHAYLKKGDLENAKAAVARARAKVYGPRAAVVLMLEGEIQEKSGDKAKAKQAYAAAKDVLSKQPPSLGVQRRLQKLEKILGTL